MLKGKAKIELINADGTKKIIEHDNMITNAVSDLCCAQRGDMASILKMTNNNDSYAQALFGGLLLFDETLNTDADDYTIPTAKITGYASQDAYAGLDVARGSFNASEGGIQEDGSYKFVWDFSTSQANGTIKSLALCPNVMGQIGASDTIVTSDIKDFYFTRSQTTPFNSDGYMLDTNGTTDGIGNYYFSIVAIIDDIAYAIDESNIIYNSSFPTRYFKNNGNILKLHKFKLGTNNISLGDRVGMARYLGAVDVQLPTDFISDLNTGNGVYNISVYYNSTDKKLTVFPCVLKSNVAPNGTITYIEIDMATFNVLLHTYTNTTPNTIFQSSECKACTSSVSSRYYFLVLKDYILSISKETSSGDGKVYVTNRSNNTDVKEAKYSNGQSLILNNLEYISPIFLNRNTFVFYTNNSNSQTKNRVYIIDLRTGIVKLTNARNLVSKDNVSFGNNAIWVKTGQKLTYVNTVNPFILTTKNNLDSPVTKTSSQTMKITYTLSEKE